MMGNAAHTPLPLSDGQTAVLLTRYLNVTRLQSYKDPLIMHHAMQ